MANEKDRSANGVNAGLSESLMSDIGVSTSFEPGGVRASRSTLQTGHVLSGRFEIRECIGAGGMGEVYRVHDRNRSIDIAIKVMRPGLTGNDAAKQRFMNEAQIAIGLSHPNIVKTNDVNQDGDYLYLTMELLQGTSLRAEMAERKQAGKTWEVEEVIQYADSVCQALSYAHKKTVHRDIKPENIWLEEDGSVKVMDFGIAKLMSQSQMTQTSTVMGTAYYMAPEQLVGARDVDHRADQYSVAVMIYELLTGKVPSGRFKSVIELRDDVGAPLSGVIDRALASQPEERFENMAVFAEQLRDALKGNVAKVKKPVKKPAVAPETASSSKGKTGIIAGAVALVLLAGVAVLYGMQSPPNPAPSVALADVAKQPESAKAEVPKAKAEPEVANPKVVEKPAEPVNAVTAEAKAPEIAMVNIPAKNYEMGKYEVTQGQWKAVMGKNPSKFKKCGDNCPVENVSWNDVQKFIKKLNGLTGKQYRLPNKTEWEYACYGGSQTEYCGSNIIDSVAWYDSNSGNKTHPAGQKQANGYGLYDMSGNVMEWMQDCYDSSCDGRELRGGSWGYYWAYARSVDHYVLRPDVWGDDEGFRVARTLP